MTDVLPRWIRLWLMLSMVVVLWDASFVLLRPYSMPGGSLSALWPPYALYVQVDLSYANLEDGFPPAQSTIGLLEILVGIAALVASRRLKVGLAWLLAFTKTTLTGTKTLLFFLVEAWSGFAHTSHNDAMLLVFAYILPNIVWVVMPFMVSWTAATVILRAFDAPSGI